MSLKTFKLHNTKTSKIQDRSSSDDFMSTYDRDSTTQAGRENCSTFIQSIQESKESKSY